MEQKSKPHHTIPLNVFTDALPVQRDHHVYGSCVRPNCFHIKKNSPLSVHYYSYIADLWEEKNFKTPRFASEYGVQSWCSYESLLEVFNKTDLDYHSNLSNYRQHHLFGKLKYII